jgi:hypothetical protein
LTVLALLVAAQLSATDVRDLRCSYVVEKVSATTAGEEKDTAKWLQQWFDGRLSARHPSLNIVHYRAEHFADVPVGEDDFLQCSQFYTEWAGQQIAGTPRK